MDGTNGQYFLISSTATGHRYGWRYAFSNLGSWEQTISLPWAVYDESTMAGSDDATVIWAPGIV